MTDSRTIPSAWSTALCLLFAAAALFVVCAAPERALAVPTAYPDAYETIEDTPLNVPAPGVLGNDIGGTLEDPLTTQLIGGLGPRDGTLILGLTGSIYYLPNGDFNGTDQFSYRCRNSSGISAHVNVTITVSPVNDAPRTRDDGALPSQVAKVLASNGTEGATFGTAVAISGDTMVVGDNLATLTGKQYAGAAYVFIRSGTAWTQQARLVASDSGQERASAGGGDLWRHYRRGCEQRVTPCPEPMSSSVRARVDRAGQAHTPDGSSSDGFGQLRRDFGGHPRRRRALHGPRNGHRVRGLRTSSCGRGPRGPSRPKLAASDGATGDYFGHSLAIWGHHRRGRSYADDARGCPMPEPHTSLTIGTTWTEQQKLTASDGAVDD